MDFKILVNITVGDKNGSMNNEHVFQVVPSEAPPSPIPQTMGTFLPPVVTSSHS